METRSGEFSPAGVECVDGNCEAPVAGEADEMGVAMLAWKRSLKGVVRIKLDEARLVAMKAVWAQPMRLVAVCRRFLEHIGRKAGSKRFQLVTVCVRLKLLDLEKFLFERVAFCNYSLMLLDEAKFRRLMFKQFLLDVEQGHVSLGAVRYAYGSLEAVKQGFERLRGACHAGDYVGWGRHASIVA